MYDGGLGVKVGGMLANPPCSRAISMKVERTVFRLLIDGIRRHPVRREKGGPRPLTPLPGTW